MNLLLFLWSIVGFFYSAFVCSENPRFSAESSHILMIENNSSQPVSLAAVRAVRVHSAKSLLSRPHPSPPNSFRASLISLAKKRKTIWRGRTFFYYYFLTQKTTSFKKQPYKRNRVSGKMSGIQRNFFSLPLKRLCAHVRERRDAKARANNKNYYYNYYHCCATRCAKPVSPSAQTQALKFTQEDDRTRRGSPGTGGRGRGEGDI